MFRKPSRFRGQRLGTARVPEPALGRGTEQSLKIYPIVKMFIHLKDLVAQIIHVSVKF